MTIQTVACLGAGLIGSSWATLFAKEGKAVRVYDLSADCLDRAQNMIRANYAALKAAEIMDDAQIAAATARIRFTPRLGDAVAGAQLVQENIVEDLEAKRAILAEVDRCNTDALFCSSSSFLKISDIARGSANPARCVGAHPYNPPHLIPLVELTQWEQTDPASVKAAYDFYRSVRKEPITLYKEAVGFIGNRLQAAYTREAVDIVTKGLCSVEDVDKASLYGLGFRYAIIGPNLNGDLNGGEGGLRDYYRKYGASFEDCLRDDMATWDRFPQEFVETLGPQGVEAEKANRPKALGNTREEIRAYRDRLLLEILKLHDKI